MAENLLDKLRRVVITERDIEIFTYLNEQKYMMANQIYSAFWPDSEVRSGTARQRLSKLVDAGFIRTLDVQKAKSEKVRLFLLTAEGIDVLKEKGLDRGFGEIGDINQYTIEHTLKLATLRCLFRDFKGVKWLSERVVRKEEHDREFFPDAVIEVSGQRIAIELENSFRERERYETRFAKYSRLNDFTLVIYILSWHMVKSWLLDIEVPQNKLCFVLYDELLLKKKDAELMNKASRIPLRSILG